MQQADDLIDGLMLFRFGASRCIFTSITLALMDWFLLCHSQGLRFYGKLGRVRPVSQAYYESEKLFFGGALVKQSLGRIIWSCTTLIFPAFFVYVGGRVLYIVGFCSQNLICSVSRLLLP